MKKLVIALLIGSVVMAGCGKKDESAVEASTAASTEASTEVGTEANIAASTEVVSFESNTNEATEATVEEDVQEEKVEEPTVEETVENEEENEDFYVGANEFEPMLAAIAHPSDFKSEEYKLVFIDNDGKVSDIGDIVGNPTIGEGKESEVNADLLNKVAAMQNDTIAQSIGPFSEVNSNLRLDGVYAIAGINADSITKENAFKVIDINDIADQIPVKVADDAWESYKNDNGNLKELPKSIKIQMLSGDTQEYPINFYKVRELEQGYAEYVYNILNTLSGVVKMETEDRIYPMLNESDVNIKQTDFNTKIVHVIKETPSEVIVESVDNDIDENIEN